MRMNKKAMTQAIPIAIFVVLGMVVVAIGSALVSNTTSTRGTVTNYTFTASNSSCTKVTNYCVLTGTTTFANATSSIAATNFSSCNWQGQYYNGFELKANDAYASSLNGKSVNATYTEIDCSYLGSGIASTILPYITLLLAVIVFVGVAKWTSEQ